MGSDTGRTPASSTSPGWSAASAPTPMPCARHVRAARGELLNAGAADRAGACQPHSSNEPLWAPPPHLRARERIAIRCSRSRPISRSRSAYRSRRWATSRAGRVAQVGAITPAPSVRFRPQENPTPAEQLVNRLYTRTATSVPGGTRQLLGSPLQPAPRRRHGRRAPTTYGI